MSIRPSLLIVAALALFAGCDAAAPELTAGTFSATLGGATSGDASGTAVYEVQAENDAPFDPFRYRATVTLHDPATGRVLYVGFDARPTVGAYRLAKYRDEAERVASLWVSAGDIGFSSTSGTLTITESSEREIAGTFQTDLECCFNPYANIPARSARTSGQFRAVPNTR